MSVENIMEDDSTFVKSFFNCVIDPKSNISLSDRFDKFGGLESHLIKTLGEVLVERNYVFSDQDLKDLESLSGSIRPKVIKILEDLSSFNKILNFKTENESVIENSNELKRGYLEENLRDSVNELERANRIISDAVEENYKSLDSVKETLPVKSTEK